MVDRTNSEMVQGTLDMLILRTLITGPAHGHTIAHVIEHTSDNVLEVEQGSLYPALHRLEHRGWVTSYWGVSENNRKAKFYELTAVGRLQLTAETDRWRSVVAAIGRILGETQYMVRFDFFASFAAFLRELRGYRLLRLSGRSKDFKREERGEKPRSTHRKPRSIFRMVAGEECGVRLRQLLLRRSAEDSELSGGTSIPSRT